MRKGNLLLVISGVTFSTSFLSKGHFDIQGHDMYFEIAYQHIFLAISIILFFIWLLFCFKK